ncbi:hypothetical protein SCG7086_BV_00010 [Chlamydiales bacterium SCGC AG-110-P3]|nr:hypothetical protein SCG7086_BV_00010 [Chlamydiales bacterium SCGC AG-110-P3]
MNFAYLYFRTTVREFSKDSAIQVEMAHTSLQGSFDKRDAFMSPRNEDDSSKPIVIELARELWVR